MWIQHLLYVCVFFLCFACGNTDLDAPGPSEYCRSHSDECLDGLRCQLNDDEEYQCLPDPSHAEGSFIPDAMVDATPASDCDDGTQNGSETDVDCGGRLPRAPIPPGVLDPPTASVVSVPTQSASRPDAEMG